MYACIIQMLRLWKIIGMLLPLRPLITICVCVSGNMMYREITTKPILYFSTQFHNKIYITQVSIPQFTFPQIASCFASITASTLTVLNQNNHGNAFLKMLPFLDWKPRDVCRLFGTLKKPIVPPKSQYFPVQFSINNFFKM